MQVDRQEMLESMQRRGIMPAAIFAENQHRKQVRKYTGEPYFRHCEEVAWLVAYHCGDDDMIRAAYLHDTVEDTDATIEQIKELFGDKVAGYVADLTDVSTLADGNRAARKAIDREHTWKASSKAQFIKLADLISNTRSIRKYDKNFAVIYLAEKRLLLDGMRDVVKDTDLFKQAKLMIDSDE